jgi:hypothetical protein
MWFVVAASAAFSSLPARGATVLEIKRFAMADCLSEWR